MSIIEKAVNRIGPGAIENWPRFEPAPGRESSVPSSGPRAQEPVATAAGPGVTERYARNEPKTGVVAGATARAGLDAPTSQQAEIDLAKLRAAGMITPDNVRSQISEEFRIIKRPLLTNAFNQGPGQLRNGNLIMVTSSFPGEGKSFCAINLAMSIAMERDHTVLLVDADVAKPSIPQFLGIDARRGLMDLVLDEDLRFSDVLVKTNVEKLTILPAGRKHAHATELLASEAMNRLLVEMAQRYSDRIIIFDSPPLLATTESRVLASRMGQLVMVVEAGKTPQEAVREALSQVVNCEVVGLLLNKGGGTLGDDQYAYGAYGIYGA